MSVIFKITVGFPGAGLWQTVSSMLITNSQDGGYRLEILKKYLNRHANIFIIEVTRSIQILRLIENMYMCTYSKIDAAFP